MAFLVTVKISAEVFQVHDSLAFISLPLNLISKCRDQLDAPKCQSSWVPPSANPPGYQTLLSGREDAQGFSLSFRLALQNFLLVASLLPASAHVSCQECRLRRLGISASLLPPQLVLAPPARTLLFILIL